MPHEQPKMGLVLMQFTLYCHPFFPLSYFCLSTLVYKKVEFELSFINLQKYENTSPKFLQINPFGLIPVLTRNDCLPSQNIFEAWSIFEFLEEKYQLKPMLPKEEPARALVRTYAHLLSTELFSLAKPATMHKTGREPLSALELIEYNKLVFKFLDTLETQIDFVRAQINIPFSALDAVFYPLWVNLLFCLPSVNRLYPRLQAYYEEIKNLEIIVAVESMVEVKQLRNIFEIIN